MPRRPRFDEPGALHHVFNRGLAHRAIFECRQDLRQFLARVIRVIREGLLELHAFALPANHFHLLVSSPDGKLSEAMRIVLSPYVRGFNRGRGRDGPLFRSRFGSRPVTTDAYLITLLRYVDQHAIEAPESLSYMSVRHYAEPRGPVWLSRSLVEELVCSIAGIAHYTPEAYARVLGASLSAREREIVERRTSSPPLDQDPLDDLIGAPPPHVLKWLRQAARLADGRAAALPLVSTATVDGLVESGRAALPGWLVRSSRKSRCAWGLLRALLLRVACGLRLKEIAVRLDRDVSTASRMLDFAGRLLQTDPEFSERAASVMSTALGRDYPGPRPAEGVIRFVSPTGARICKKLP